MNKNEPNLTGVRNVNKKFQHSRQSAVRVLTIGDKHKPERRKRTPSRAEAGAGDKYHQQLDPKTASRVEENTANAEQGTALLVSCRTQLTGLTQCV